MHHRLSCYSSNKCSTCVIFWHTVIFCSKECEISIRLNPKTLLFVYLSNIVHLIVINLDCENKEASQCLAILHTKWPLECHLAQQFPNFHDTRHPYFMATYCRNAVTQISHEISSDPGWSRW